MLVGQQQLKRRLYSNYAKFPRFSIIVGESGSGKRLIANMIAHDLNLVAVNVGIKVNDVKEMIVNAYKVVTPTLYILADADRMSPQAKNALLKITEEPPNNAYFLMTLEDESHTLETIKSRGIIFRMNPYSVYDLTDYATAKYKPTHEQLQIIINICTTPKDIDLLMSYKPNDFYEYVETVVNNIANVQVANALKIAQKIAFKNEDGLYNLKLFWRAFNSICIQKLEKTNDLKYAKAVIVTSKYLNELSITGINQNATFDMWVLDIRNKYVEG